MRPYPLIVAHEISRVDEEVREVEAPRLVLGRFIGLDHRPELISQARRKVGAGVFLKALQARV